MLAVTGRSEQREPRSGGLRSSTPGNSSETVSKELGESRAASLDLLRRPEVTLDRAASALGPR